MSIKYLDNNGLSHMLQKIKTLLNKKIDNDKIWIGTMAQYNALTEKNANTIYNITDEQDVNKFGDYIIQVKDSTDSLESNNNIITFII